VAETFRVWGTIRVPADLADDIDRWAEEDDRTRAREVAHILRLYQRKRRDDEAAQRITADPLDDELRRRRA
jgi:hypothetical protein